MAEWRLNKASKESFQEQIVRLLITEIESGKYSDGDKLPSLRNLGEAFNVSHETVKCALYTLRKKGLVEIFPKRGAFVRFDKIVNSQPINHTLGIVIDLGYEINQPTLLVTNLFDRYIGLFSQELMSRSYNLTAQYVCFERERDRIALDGMLKRVDGLFVIRLNNTNLRDFLKDFRKPVMTIIPAIDPQCFDSVGIHDYETYYSLTKKVIHQKYRFPLYFDGPFEYQDRSNRIAGFLAACQAANIEDLTKRVLFSEAYSVEAYYRKIKEWLKLKIPLDVVIASNDNYAVGALRALIEAGFSVPKDVALIGQGNTPLSIASLPTLSSLDIHYEQLITLATERMLHLLNIDRKPSQPVKTLIDGTLIYRETFPNENRS